MIPKIKICGLTTEEEASWLCEEQVEFGGMVLFFEKSKRCITLEKAGRLIRVLKNGNVKSIAVTVSPSFEQIRQIEEAGFDYLQIHGEIEASLVDEVRIPLIRAVQVTEEREKSDYAMDKACGILYDAAVPGSGETFNWGIDKIYRPDNKLFFLAGGLHPDNVIHAIGVMKPDVVDVSSGVEVSKETVGKDRNKIRLFVERVRQLEE